MSARKLAERSETTGSVKAQKKGAVKKRGQKARSKGTFNVLISMNVMKTEKKETK